MPQRISTLSQKRFDTYLIAAGHNQERALALYVWNAQVGASFHILIQAIEVSLRNRINHALVAEFGSDWWRDSNFLRLIDRSRLADITTTQKRIANQQIAIDTNQMVAGLSFGFWVGMMHRRYNPKIWSRHLNIAFPDLPPGATRQMLFDACGSVARFRNRVSHHEPLLKVNVSQTYADMQKLLFWLCPATSTWIKPHCEVPSIIRRKP